MGLNLEQQIYVMSNVLRCQLDENDIGLIKEDWRAFYEAPQEYEGDKLCDLILEDLGKQADPDWNKTDGGKEMDLEIAMLGVEGVEVNHWGPDDSLGWGKFNGKDFYLRKVERSQWYPLTSAHTNNVRDYVWNSGCPDAFLAVVYQGEEDYIVYVGCSNMDDPERYAPTGYSYVGVILLDSMETMLNPDMMKNIEMLYVPFNDGPNGSKLPIIWRDTTIGVSANGEHVLDMTKMIEDGVLMEDEINDIIGDISKKLPPVDLETDKGHRYPAVEVTFHVGIGVEEDAMFCYNRNNIAHNGKLSNLEAAIPVWIHALQIIDTDRIEETNLHKLIAGSIDKDSFVFRMKTDVSNAEPGTPVSANGAKHTPELDVAMAENRIHRGSSMLDAVKTSAGSVRE